MLNDFDLLDFTESLDEFDEELDQTLDDAEVDALDKEIEEMDELEVHIVFLAMVHNAFKDILYINIIMFNLENATTARL